MKDRDRLPLAITLLTFDYQVITSRHCEERSNPKLCKSNGSVNIGGTISQRIIAAVVIVVVDLHA